MNHMKVLCLDDNKRHLKTISDKVENQGHEVVSVTNIDDAFKVLDSSFDCIVSDYDLTEKERNGIWFCNEARKRGFHNTVIFITSMCEIFKETESLQGDVRIILKKSRTFKQELESNLHNCFAKRVKEVTGSYEIF